MFQFSTVGIYVSNIKKSTFSSVQEALSFCPNKPTKKKVPLIIFIIYWSLMATE